MNLGTISKDLDKLAAAIIAALCVLVIAYGVTAVEAAQVPTTRIISFLVHSRSCRASFGSA